MNLRQLRYFCEIVDSGSAAQAAARLYVAPTAVSMQLAQLESELGGELFDRARRPMELTPLGRHFYPRAKELITSATRLKEETQGIAGGQRGWLAVGFTRSAMFSVLPRAIRRFRARLPDVQLELLPMQSEQQAPELLTGRIQVGVSRFLGPYDKVEGLDYQLIAQDPFVAAIPRNHPLARRKTIDAAELSGTPYVAYPKVPQSHYAEDVSALLRAAGATPVATYHADEIHIALGMVASGLGFCLVGRSVCEGSRSDVAFVPLSDIKEKGDIVAVTKSPQTAKVVGPFVDALILGKA
ncbi:DNA-binding transcriptional regulator, LysR family [Variovorax sp. CF079]|uniref:LysR family transcriptional regulator n=1 Tax=Variovorax sp. CF079 TaxID=1882774 RepID=UPI00088438CF|nr:LysR family transcriptional regulator [Variovorax sp. CF079]SDE93665.1 DNA-binding transcriptional regulator, LysR family [Variovorax sp. CF079]